MTGHPVLVIGVDPGPTTGIVAIAYNDGAPSAPPMILQCDAHSAVFFVGVILDVGPAERWLGLEQFVIGNRTARSSNAGAGRITRDLIGALLTLTGPATRVHLKIHNAMTAKTWATDRKLDAAGLLAPTKGMNHARDAARHALFCAVKQDITPDPMSPRAAALAVSE